MATSHSEVSNIFLVGSQIETLDKRQLPTNREVLSYFSYQHNHLKLSIRQSARNVIDEVKDIWSEVKIPTSQSCHSVNKLEKLHQEWTKLKKSLSRTSLTIQKHNQEFGLKLDTLFDITNQNSITT